MRERKGEDERQKRSKDNSVRMGAAVATLPSHSALATLLYSHPFTSASEGVFIHSSCHLDQSLKSACVKICKVQKN